VASISKIGPMEIIPVLIRRRELYRLSFRSGKVSDRSRSIPSRCIGVVAAAACRRVDGRLFPHDITPPAFRERTTIFYFLDGSTLVARKRPAPTEMRRPDQFLLPPSPPPSRPRRLPLGDTHRVRRSELTFFPPCIFLLLGSL